MITRRLLLAAGVAAPLSWETCERQEMQTPWQMWGSTQNIQVPATTIDGATASQIVFVDYHRPETWSFFFLIKPGGVSGTPPPGANIRVLWQLTFGVGRSTVNIQNFEIYELLHPIGTGATSVARRSTVARQPERIVGDGVPNLVEWIPASNINIDCRVLWDVIDPLSDAIFSCQVSAYVAPRSHTRPDWFAGQFGSELNGT